MKFLVLIALMTVSIGLQAMQTGDIRFLAKVESFDAKWIHVTAGEHHYRVPRTAYKCEKLNIGFRHEFTLSAEEFSQMRTHEMLEKLRKS